MKTASKVFIWIGMIIQFFLIYPIVIGIFALKKINSATSRDELQTWGIITTLFCSLLGGIFMLCLKDTDLLGTVNSSSNGIVVYRKTVVEKQKNEDIDDTFLKGRKYIKAIIYTFLSILLLSIPFSIAPIEEYWGTAFIPLIITGVEIIVFSVMFAFYLYNHQTTSKTTYYFLVSLAFLSCLQIIFTLVSNFCFAYTERNPGGNVLYRVYGEAWEFWVLFGMAIITLTLSLVIFYIARKYEQPSNEGKPLYFKVKKEIVTSNIEIELNELQKLLDTKVITDDEYQTLRKNLIASYYN